MAELESAESCSSVQEQLAGVVLLLALAELGSAESCSGQEQLTGILLALAELESAEARSGRDQLAGVALALAWVEIWKEEAAAVKRKACISFKCSLLDIS